MIECLIFDCDGTLVDSEWLCQHALAEQLRPLGVIESAESLIGRYQGGKLASMLEDLASIHSTRFPDNFVTDYRARVSELFQGELEACAGVVEALERISIPICVASSGPPEKIRTALAVTGLARYFGDRIYSSYEVGSWKPDPGILLHAAECMGVAPNRCVLVDDSTRGLAAAQAAGMTAVHYCPAGQPGQENVPQLIDMRNLPALLARLQSPALGAAIPDTET